MGAIWGYWTLDDPETSRATRHSSHGSSGPTSHSSLRHGEMPRLLKHSSLAHIIWGCSSQGEESQGFPSRASGTVPTSSLALLCTGGCSGPPCHDPFSSPSPPLPMLEKISFSRFWGLFFFLSPWQFYTSLCQCLCYRLCCVYSTAPTLPHHIHMLKPYLLMWLYLEIEPLRKCWDQINLYAGQEATVRIEHGTTGSK